MFSPENALIGCGLPVANINFNAQICKQNAFVLIIIEINQIRNYNCV